MADTATAINPQSLAELISQLKVGNQNLSKALVNLNATLAAIFPQRLGSFTMAAAVSTTVSNVNVTASSKIVLSPTNAAAATLQGSAKCLYISALVAGTSFTVTTGSGVAATGGGTFDYALFNPV
jgi:hypothetical protein